MVLGSLLRRIVHEEDEYDSDDCLKRMKALEVDSVVFVRSIPDS